MPELVQLNLNLQIIEVDSSGEISVADLEHALISVLKCVQENSACGVLVDTRKQKSLPKIADYNRFIESLPSPLRIAVLVSDTGKTRSQQHTGEFFALRAKKNYKLFYKKELAINWLRCGTSPPR